MNNIKFAFLALAILLFTACGQFGEGEYTPNTPETITPETVVEVQNNEVVFKDVVRDTDNNEVVAATVTLYADSKRYSSTTDANGQYEIKIAREMLPTQGFMSISVVADGYKPHNLTYEANRIDSGTYGSDADIQLSPCPDCIQINGDKSGELVHLGDDQYAGAANSQFQKSTDGTTRSFQFENSAEYVQLIISFEAKGLQPSNFDLGSSVVLGEGEAEEYLWDSPEDGSYGKYSITVTNSPAAEFLTLKTRDHGTPGTDYDDWEFTCLHIEGVQ